MVDGLGVGDVGNIVLRDRQHLSQDGLIVIVMTMDSSTGEIVCWARCSVKGICLCKRVRKLNGRCKKSNKRRSKKMRRKTY